MIERATLSDDPDLASDSPALDPTVFAALEQRVRRLESEVAGLRDTRVMEERIAERVSHQVSAPDPTGMIIEASRHILPLAAESARPVAIPAEPHAPPQRRGWLLLELYTEARAMLYMFVDPRYQLSWQGRFIPLVIVLLIAADWIWVPGASLTSVTSIPLLPLVAHLWLKAVDLVLAYVLFKVLSREAQRYRQTAPNLPPHLRL